VSKASQDEPPEKTATPQRLRILVVDDEPMMVKLVTRSLQRVYDVTGSSDPRAVLERILAGEAFDLILCDLSMPGMSGEELFRAIARSSPECAAKFVFLTGGATTDSAQQFLDSLPNERIAKPVTPASLLALVRKLVGGR
jgi:CheY-like chemotaxis protein